MGKETVRQDVVVEACNCRALHLCKMTLTAAFQSAWIVDNQQNLLTGTGLVSKHVCKVQMVLWKGREHHHSEVTCILEEV